MTVSSNKKRFGAIAIDDLPDSSGWAIDSDEAGDAQAIKLF
jgi:hypothetical protein